MRTPRRISRPVKVDPPLSRAAFIDPKTGFLTPHGFKVISFIRDRLGGDDDSVWTALGLGLTGLSQFNQVNQRVAEVENAAAVAQMAVAGLRGDPRFEDSVRALELAITALVQVQARASGESDKRVSDLDRLVASLGGRLTTSSQRTALIGEQREGDALASLMFQTAIHQRQAATATEVATDVDILDRTLEDRVSDLITNGTGLSWTYNPVALTLTGDVSLTPFDTDDLSEGSRLYYTDERVDDRVSVLVQNGTGISWSYNDGAGTLTPTVSLASFSTTNLSEGMNLYYTDERVDDRVASLIQNGTGITWSYNDGAGTLTPTVTVSSPDRTLATTAPTFVDDFIMASTETGEVGDLGWSSTGTVATFGIAAEANHPGLIRVTTGIVANVPAGLHPGTGTATVNLLFSANDTITWVVKPEQTTDVTYRVGWINSHSSATPTDGFYLERLSTDANWYGVSRTGGAQTRTAAMTAFSAAWFRLTVRRIDASNVGFSIDGGTEVVVSANIPAGTVTGAWCLQIIPTTTTSKSGLVDFTSCKLVAPTR